MPDRTLAQVFQGLLAAQTGVMQGQQQKREFDLQQAELARRAKLQDQDQLMQLFSTGARLEQQGIDDQLAGDDYVLRNSEPGAEGWDDLVTKAGAHRQQVLGGRQYTADALPGYLSGGGRMGAMPSAPASAGTSTVFSAQGNAAPRGVVPQGGGQAYQPLVPVRSNPAKKTFANDLDMWRTNAFNSGDTESAIQLQELQNGITSGKISLEVGQPKFREIVSRLQAQGLTKERLSRSQKAGTELQDLLQQGQIVDEDVAEGSALAGELLAADTATADATLKKYQDYRKRARLQESSTSRANKATGERLTQEAASKRLEADWGKRVATRDKALASKSPKQLLIALEAEQRFADEHPEFAKDVWGQGRIDTRQRDVTRRVPVKGLPPTAEDLDNPPMEDAPDKETAAERDARVAVELSDVWKQDDPKVALDLRKEALGRLWTLARDPQATEGARNDALARIHSIAETTPGLEGIYPKSIKLSEFTPYQRYQIERNKVLYQDNLAKEKDLAEGRRLENQLRRQQLQKGVKELAGSKLDDRSKQAMGLFKDQAERAQKRIDTLSDKPAWEQSADPGFDAKLDAAKQERDGALAKFYQGLAGADPVAPIREDAAKKRVLSNIERATRLNGGVPLTPAQLNAISRRVRGVQ